MRVLGEVTSEASRDEAKKMCIESLAPKVKTVPSPCSLELQNQHWAMENHRWEADQERWAADTEREQERQCAAANANELWERIAELESQKLDLEAQLADQTRVAENGKLSPAIDWKFQFGTVSEAWT